MTPYTFRPGMLSVEAAAALNAMARMADGQTQIRVLPPLSIVRQGFNRQPVIYLQQSPDSFYAEITGSGSGSGSGSGVDGDRLAYSWVERVEVRAGAWADGPRSGELNAYVAEPRAGWVGVVDAGTVVEMRASPTVSGVYEFLPECCGDGSGSGGQITVITDICLDGVGGGYVRKGIIDIDTRSIIYEWCEPIGACGSGSGGGLCPDVPSGSGSGWTPEGCPTGYALSPGNQPWTRIDEDTWTNGTLTMTRAGVNWQIIDSANPTCLWENNGWDGTIPSGFVTFGEVSGNCVTDYEIQCYVP